MPETAPIPGASNIPDKLYFRIGDVSKLTGIKPYVLRFWENEFSGLGPKKSGTGHRLYRRKDVEMVLEIKHLLYDERYTIEGARKWLEARAKGEAARPVAAASNPEAKTEPRGRKNVQCELFPRVAAADLDRIRAGLRAVLDILK